MLCITITWRPWGKSTSCVPPSPNSGDRCAWRRGQPRERVVEVLETGSGTGEGSGCACRRGLAQARAVGCQGRLAAVEQRYGLLEMRPLVGLVREPAPCPPSQIQGTSCTELWRNVQAKHPQRLTSADWRVCHGSPRGPDGVDARGQHQKLEIDQEQIICHLEGRRGIGVF